MYECWERNGINSGRGNEPVCGRENEGVLADVGICARDNERESEILLAVELLRKWTI